MLLNTYQEIYDMTLGPIRALIFQKLVKICVYMSILNSRCKFMTLVGSTCSKKMVGWEVMFSELRFAGFGARKPRREFDHEGIALDLFVHVVLRVNGL